MVSQLALLLAFLIVLLIMLLVFRGRRKPALRTIAAFDVLPGQTGRAAESGRTLHLSLGTGGIGGSETVASLAALSALAHLAEQGVAADTPPVVTVSDPTLVPLAQHILLEAYRRQGRSRDYDWSQVRLISPVPLAYALGAMDLLRHQPVLANVMLGAFGPEVGLIAHAGADAELVQISGTDDPEGVAVLSAMDDRVIIGEELYATETYLHPTGPKVSSLVAQDVIRVVLVSGMILVAVLRILGAL